MRRMLCWLLLLGTVGLTTGCHLAAGVCDCALDPDPCMYRAPWIRLAPPSPETLPAPGTPPQ